MQPKELPIKALHNRHWGVDQTLAGTYAQAAEVCLARHHEPPANIGVSGPGRADEGYSINWEPPGERERVAYGNPVDASHSGGYGLVLAALDVHLGMVVVGRAPIGSGSDCYVQPIGNLANPLDARLDLEAAIRLEVSGIDCDGEAQLNAHVRRKLKQVNEGDSATPGMAGVAGFKQLKVIFRAD